MRFQYPQNLSFSCSKCGICCGDTKTKTRHILLLEKEAEQIAVSTRKKLDEFAYTTSGNLPYIYEMKKTSAGKCIFLTLENTCAIYSLRPLICRFYPFELDAAEPENPVFKSTSECPGISTAHQQKNAILDERYFKRLFQLANSAFHGL